MIKVDNIKKSYGNFQLECNFHLKKGHVVGIVGKNGSGKTTLFKAIMGLINLDSGSIEIRVGDYQGKSDRKKELIGTVFSDSNFASDWNIRELAKVYECMYRDFNTQHFFMECEKAKLPINKNINKFSAGMKARLRIICAMSFSPRILILDEPTAGLDVTAREEILGDLRKYMMSEENSILISSHISSDLEELCDEIYILDEGRILLCEEMNIILDCYGILKLDEIQFSKIDKFYIEKIKKEKYQIVCLTKNREFYLSNYKDIVIEKAKLDDIIKLMTGGCYERTL